jgi:hypothetical protein
MIDALIGTFIGGGIGMLIALIIVMCQWKIKYGKWWL